jgi:hypothetical protein
MDDWMIAFVGIIAGIALGIGISLILKKEPPLPVQQETGVMYNYDDQNRLQSITPMNIRLKAI